MLFVELLIHGKEKFCAFSSLGRLRPFLNVSADRLLGKSKKAMKMLEILQHLNYMQLKAGGKTINFFVHAVIYLIIQV